MSQQDSKDFFVTFPENRIPDFFYLLRDFLYTNKCLSSTNWVYQDSSTKLHEFRYHICAILTDDKKMGPDFSEYRGTHATFKLIKMIDRFKVLITLERESDYEGYLPKKTPWQEDFIRLKRKPLSIIPSVTLNNIIKAEELTAKEKEFTFDNISRSIKDTVKIVSKNKLQGAAWREIILLVNRYIPSLSSDEKRELAKILKESYYRMRSAAVHSAKTRGLEYDSEEKTRFYLPDEDHFEPDWLKISYYYDSLKQLYYTFMIEWLKKQ